MEIKDKNLIEYIADLSTNDSEVIKLLSSNKKTNEPEIYKRIAQKRYPDLLKFKYDGEDWRMFFLRIVKFMALLKEKFDITYDTKNPLNSPEIIYANLRLIEEAIKQLKIMLYRKRPDSGIYIEINLKRGQLDQDFVSLEIPENNGEDYLIRKYDGETQTLLMEEGRYSTFPSIKEIYEFVKNDKINEIAALYNGDWIVNMKNFFTREFF